MRCFVLVCVLATAAYADVSHLGYTYQQGHGHGGHSGHSVSSFSDGSSGFSGGGSASFGSANLGGQIGGGAAGFGAGSIGGGSSGFGAGSIGGGSSGFSSGSSGFGAGSSGFGAGSIGGGFTSGGHSHHAHHRVEQAPAEVEFVKEFYTFDAPEEEYHEDESIQRTRESLKKNLQVLFIKTPEIRGIEQAALSLAKTASESNTAIYILQKQPDVAQFSNQLNLIHTHNAHKPEVHFVKYRTPEEAAHAQHTIQSQYESLGGSSVHKHGGVPEILNYASNYAPGFGAHQVVSGGSQHAVSGGHQTYHTGAIIAPSSGAHHTHHESSHTVVTTGDAPSQTYLPAKA